METLFRDIPLDRVSVSMTINGPAIVLFCFYVAAAEKQGVSPERLRGTVQNDILKEYQAQHAWVFPPDPALRLILDMFEWCGAHAPHYNPVSISGYHIREAGATAGEELAFTLANGFEYVRRGVERGLDVDAFAPRLSFFFDVHNDFFEEVAKFRAARRIWARRMRGEFGAENPHSWRLRTHAQTAGVTLTAQQPENNIVRVAYQALAAVLGGTQSLHTNSMDETLALPTEKAATIALRTQQILAWETGVPNTIDPLAGSYYVEALTDRLEAEAEEIFERIEEQGGVVPGIENGWFQRRIAASAARQQAEVEAGYRKVVGVNDFTEGADQLAIDTLRIDPVGGGAAAGVDGPAAGGARRRAGPGDAGGPARRGGGRGELGAADPGVRPSLLHPVRDTRRHGGRVRGVQGAGLLLDGDARNHGGDHDSGRLAHGQLA